MPIVIDIENDSLVRKWADRHLRSSIERMLELGKLTIAEIALVLNVTKDFVIQISNELEEEKEK